MSKNEICRYHNDLNKVRLPQFSELQLNLFYHLIHKMRHKQQGELVEFNANEIQKMLGQQAYRFNNTEILEITKSLFMRLFQANFKRIYPTSEEYINIFKIMKIEYNDKENTQINSIKLETNEHFEYLLGELNANYTEFELTELVSISGKYTKLLYTHLKQYRATGVWLVKWEDFKEILDIPATYRPCDIDNFVLKPAIKELTVERNLLNQQRTPFKNLKYEKLTKNKEPNRRKLTPYYIRFTFAKEIISEPKPKSEAQIAMMSKNITNDELTSKSFSDYYNGEKQIFRIDDIIDKAEENKIILACSVFDKKLNLLSGYYTKSFSNISSAKKFVLENEYKI